MAKFSGLATAGVQVTNYNEALDFYTKILGFEKKSDMGPQSCWGKIGTLGLYIEGNCNRVELQKEDTKICLVLDVDNVEECFNEMKALGACIDDKLNALNMENIFWFRFRDPAGNILEAAGAKK